MCIKVILSSGHAIEALLRGKTIIKSNLLSTDLKHNYLSAIWNINSNILPIQTQRRC